MTYLNGDVYAGPTASAPLDKYAHDDCLPADQLETVTMGNGDSHVAQRWPWHWHPSPTGFTNPCYVCGKPVT
jgi:hypothetical protein